MHHVAFEAVPLRGTWLEISRFFVRFNDQGYVGVAIFFVLSGFLITMRYADTAQLNGQWLRAYFQNRFARIYPVFFLLTVFTFVTMLVPQSEHYTYFSHWYQWPTVAYNTQDKWTVFFLNLTLTRGYFADLLLVGVPTAWSLTVEECFYASAPVLLLLARWRRSWLYAAPVVLLILGGAMVLLSAPWQRFYHPMQSLSFMLNATYFGHGVEFLAGMGLALALRRGTVNGGWLSGRATLVGALGIAACMALMASLATPKVSEVMQRPLINVFINNFLVPLPVCLLLWGLVVERTWLQRLLQTPTMDLLGKSSYVFYLLHVGALDTFISYYITDSWGLRLVLYTLLSIGLYKGFEHPLHLRLKAKPKTAKGAVATAAI